MHTTYSRAIVDTLQGFKATCKLNCVQTMEDENGYLLTSNARKTGRGRENVHFRLVLYTTQRQEDLYIMSRGMP